MFNSSFTTKISCSHLSGNDVCLNVLETISCRIICQSRSALTQLIQIIRRLFHLSSLLKLSIGSSLIWVKSSSKCSCNVLELTNLSPTWPSKSFWLVSGLPTLTKILYPQTKRRKPKQKLEMLIRWRRSKRQSCKFRVSHTMSYRPIVKLRAS